MLRNLNLYFLKRLLCCKLLKLRTWPIIMQLCTLIQSTRNYIKFNFMFQVENHWLGRVSFKHAEVEKLVLSPGHVILMFFLIGGGLAISFLCLLAEALIKFVNSYHQKPRKIRHVPKMYPLSLAKFPQEPFYLK